MLMPSIFRDNLWDDFFQFPFQRGVHANGLMSTDIAESDQGYELTMNMPGVKREDVKAELKDGYLTIHTTTGSEKEDKDGSYIRRERYVGSCMRSFYVGKEVTQEEIKAKFENGTLKLWVPKKEAAPAVEENKNYIAIEG